jgi:hypothetical protein
MADDKDFRSSLCHLVLFYFCYFDFCHFCSLDCGSLSAQSFDEGVFLDR